VAVEEINADVDELNSASHIEKYWTALGLKMDTSLPWSGVFVAWAIKQVDNPDGIKLSASNIQMYRSARSLGLRVSSGKPPLPGDIAFYVRTRTDLDQVDTDALFPSAIGIVHEVTDQTVTLINGNSYNAIRLTERARSDPLLVGYIRLGKLVN
jgi:hypothetical protein